MPDPLTLGVIGTAVLTEGIEFLYEQAGALLERWRDRRDRSGAAGADESTAIPATEALAGQLQPVVPNWDVVDRFAEEIETLRGELAAFRGGRTPSVDDAELLRRVDALRMRLELALGQRISFVGEAREPSGTRIVDIRQRVDELERSEAIGIRAKPGQGGTIAPSRMSERCATAG